MNLGPWLIWLTFAHGIRPYDNGHLATYGTLAIAYITGLTGAYFVIRSAANWSLEWRLFGLAAYAVGLAVSMPMIGLLSVCTTGDCL